MDLDDALRAWCTNDEISRRLLALCPDEAMELKPGRGKTIRSNFVHILSVRRMHIEEKLPAVAAPLPKLDWKTAPREDIHAALTLSGQGMEQLLQHRAARTRPDRWSLATFLAYAIAHEAHHRSQIEIALRLGGHEPDEMDLYALWDWPKISRDLGDPEP